MIGRLALLTAVGLADAAVLELLGIDQSSHIKMNNARISAQCESDRTPAWLIAAPKAFDVVPNVWTPRNVTARLASECQSPTFLTANPPRPFANDD